MPKFKMSKHATFRSKQRNINISKLQKANSKAFKVAKKLGIPCHVKTSDITVVLAGKKIITVYKNPQKH